MSESLHDLKRLEIIRLRLRAIDEKIFSLFIEREDESRDVAVVKARLGRPSYDEVQEDRMIYDRRQMGEAMGLDPDFIEAIMHTIHDHSLDIQNEVRADIASRAPVAPEA